MRDHHVPECVDGGPDEVWDPDDGNYTRHSPTDAFGELEFQGVWTSTRAKVNIKIINKHCSDNWSCLYPS